MIERSDFLVLGSGVAGLLAARKLARLGTVHDTLKAGAGLCHDDIVRIAVEEGPARIQELMDIGVRFTERDRKLDLGLEGGHSQRRVLHAGDLTGREIERALVEACRSDPAIRLFENHVAVDLILEHHPGERPAEHNRATGAWALDNPGLRPDYERIFPRPIADLRESFFSERKRQIGNINQDLLVYLVDGPDGMNSESVTAVQTTLDTLKGRFGYCDKCAKDAVLALLKKN